MKTNLQSLFFLTILLFINQITSGQIVISGYLANPGGTDSPYEYVQLKATQSIDFSGTPYSMVVCNNGTASMLGWIAGGSTTYGFNLTSGIVQKNEEFYVGGDGKLISGSGSTNISSAKWIKTINTGNTTGDGFGNFSTGGVFGNGGTSADGVGLFYGLCQSLSSSTIPIDAAFWGTGIGTSKPAVGGYTLPNNDIYSTSQGTFGNGTNIFLFPDPGSNAFVRLSGTYNTTLNTWETSRTSSLIILNATSSLSTISSLIQLSSTSSVATVLPTISIVETLTISAVENQGILTINVSIVNSTSNSSSVDISIVQGTSVLGADYTLNSSTLVFPPNFNSNVKLLVTINDDSNIETDEYFSIKLSNPKNAQLGNNTELPIFINDNDVVAPQQDKFFELSFLSSFKNMDKINTGSSEISAFDPSSKKLFIANSLSNHINIVDLTNPAMPVGIYTINVATYGNVNSISAKNGVIAFCTEASASNWGSAGKIVFIDHNGSVLNVLNTGVQPDMIAISPDGKYLLTANEGEPSVNFDIDPEGSVAIVNLQGGVLNLTQNDVTLLTFNHLNGKLLEYKQKGIRIFGINSFNVPSTVAQDFEPEYIAISPNSKTAYVTLQENNAIMTIDLQTQSIISVNAIGFKNHLLPENSIDVSDLGKIHLANYPIKGMFMPDAIDAFDVSGTTYCITANEGDTRVWGSFNEESMVKDLQLYTVNFPNSKQFKNDYLMGKLLVSNKMGDSNGDGIYEELYSFGGRSFSIFKDGEMIYDSKNDFEMITSIYSANIFNSNDNKFVAKKRSTKKGVEPEGVIVADINNRKVAFISCERMGGVFAYDVTNPLNPQYVTYATNKFGGDYSPEGIIFVKATDSPNGKSLLILSNEVSSSISIFEISIATNIENNETPYQNNESESKLVCYPNPVSDLLFLSRNIDCQVYTIYGKMIKAFKDVNSIDFSEFKNGLYFIKTNSKSFRIVVSH